MPFLFEVSYHLETSLIAWLEYPSPLSRSLRVRCVFSLGTLRVTFFCLVGVKVSEFEIRGDDCCVVVFFCCTCVQKGLLFINIYYNFRP